MALEELSSDSAPSSNQGLSCSSQDELEGVEAVSAEQQIAEALPAPKYATIIEDDEVTRASQMEMLRLLRGRRYFDEPAVSEARIIRCFKCGLSGHMSRDCTSQVSVRPCYLCAIPGHDGKDCPNRVCFRCGKTGHISRDCSGVSKEGDGGNVCLKCGQGDCAASAKGDYCRYEGGCNTDYSKSDLKQCRCFVCGKLGHLSCKPAPSNPAQTACVFCGSSQHLGMDCPDGLPTHLEAERRGDRHAAETAVTSYFGTPYDQNFQHGRYRDVRDNSPFQRGNSAGLGYRYADQGRFDASPMMRASPMQRDNSAGRQQRYGQSKHSTPYHGGHKSRSHDNSRTDRRNSHDSRGSRW